MSGSWHEPNPTAKIQITREFPPSNSRKSYMKEQKRPKQQRQWEGNTVKKRRAGDNIEGKLVSLHKICCTRAIENKFSCRSFAISLRLELWSLRPLLFGLWSLRPLFLAVVALLRGRHYYFLALLRITILYMLK
jgi:hypothetical protein